MEETLKVIILHVAYIHRGKPIVGRKSVMDGITNICAGRFRLLQTGIRLLRVEKNTFIK